MVTGSCPRPAWSSGLDLAEKIRGGLCNEFHLFSACSFGLPILSGLSSEGYAVPDLPAWGARRRAVRGQQTARRQSLGEALGSAFGLPSPAGSDGAAAGGSQAQAAGEVYYCWPLHRTPEVILMQLPAAPALQRGRSG